jgi:drug/metabolite transporter (DMT)-like permease
MEIKNHKYLPAIVFTSLCLIWSSTWMVIKIGLWSLPPFLSAGLRFSLAYLLLFMYAIKKNIKFPRDIKTHTFFLWFGVVNFCAGYALVYWAEQYIGSGLASVLFSVMPFYVLFLSLWLLPQDKINLKKLFGIVIGFCGVMLIFWDQVNIEISNNEFIYGMGAVLISPIFASLGTVIGKRVSNNYHPITLITFPILYASLSFFIMSFLFESNMHRVFDLKAVFSIIYLAVFGTAIAFFLYFWMLKNTPAVLMSMITFITPPLALIWGWFILDELITENLIFGMILILFGIFIVRI